MVHLFLDGKSNSPLLKIIGKLISNLLILTPQLIIISDKSVIGGSESIKNQWPWMVYITGPQGPLVCGGTLISDEWVLTSASCLPE